MGYAGGVFTTEDPNERKYRKYTDRVLIKRLGSYIFRYRPSLILVFVSLIFTAFVGVAGPYLLGISLNDMQARNLQGVIVSISIIFVLYLVNYVSDNRRTYHMQLLGQNVIHDLRRDGFAKLQDLSPSYYSKRETGRIMSYITNDVDALSDFVTFQVPQVLAGVVIIAAIIPFMLILNFQLSLVSFAVVPALVLLTLAFQGRIQTSFVETRKKIAIVTSKLQEGISGVRVTQSLVNEDRVNENFDSVNTENLKANLGANKLTSLFSALVQVIEATGMALVIYYGTTKILSGELSIGFLISFLFYVNSFFNPVIQLTTFYNSYQSAVTGFDRVLQVLDTPVEVKPPAVRANQDTNSDYAIEFQDVTFGYDKNIPVLNNLNMKIRKNEVVAIVGPTGAGKSSLVNLILRFYDPQQGVVKFNGVDLKEQEFADFRQKMSIVPQDPFLFLSSITGNVKYGSPEVSDEKVIQVSKEIGMDEFVKRFPLGYNTLVNESATNLSMGQKQMICFARALVKDPELLILDEATSGVDPVSEVQLQRALERMLKGRTTLIIAHRLSTIRLASRIFVLNQGRIVEEGSFQDLMGLKEGTFSRMYRMQQTVI
jgi:ABC-type multidrug transport system fused ATPase/permease subunit